MRSPESNPPSTLIDVARLAGVSPSTVSRILNGTAKVSDDKRQAVLAAIDQMHFAPNPMAQALKMGRSMTIGIVVAHFSSPFFDETLRGVDEALRGTGYASVIVSGQADAATETERMRLLVARKVDGMILLSASLDNEAIAAFARQRPIVATGRTISQPRVLGFKFDNEYGAWLAVRHLLELGHRRIAFLGGPADHADAIERLAGYRRALEETGITFDPALVGSGEFNEAGGQQGLERLLAAGIGFSAVFAANDLSAYGARLCLYRHGIDVPGQVSLAGFDDLPGSAYTTPPLTTVRQPLFEMGYTAAASLLGLINGDAPEAVLAPIELVVRESTAPVSQGLRKAPTQ
ncbi:MAG: LacI family DNA-binding transcriptional regulator [Pseudomonadota bacterium]